jgi:hypothetical protein
MAVWANAPFRSTEAVIQLGKIEASISTGAGDWQAPVAISAGVSELAASGDREAEGVLKTAAWKRSPTGTQRKLSSRMTRIRTWRPRFSRPNPKTMTPTRMMKLTLCEVKMAKGSETLVSAVYARNKDGQVTTATSKGLPGGEVTEDAYDENNRLTKYGSTEYNSTFAFLRA